jgi:hypothetical protein
MQEKERRDKKLMNNDILDIRKKIGLIMNITKEKDVMIIYQKMKMILLSGNFLSRQLRLIV